MRSTTYPQHHHYDEGYFQRFIAMRDRFVPVARGVLDAIDAVKGPGSLLDVGCGIGILLSEARGRGWEVKGVEVAEWAASYAQEQGLPVINSGLREAKLAPMSFDVIVMTHVLEHMEHPEEELSEACRLLKADGLLVIRTPNFASLMARWERQDWPLLRAQEHVWFFSPRTLRRLLKEAGLEVTSVRTAVQPREYRFTPKDLTRRISYGLAVLFNAGEMMLVFARKESGLKHI